MCLAAQGQLLHVDRAQQQGVARIDGQDRDVSLVLCPDVTVGAQVLVHSGVVIEVSAG